MAGGLFRDNNVEVLGALVENLGTGSAYFTEVSAVVEIVMLQGWSKVWFEMDSSLTLGNFFKRGYSLPWQLRRRWENCIVFLDSFSYIS